MIHKKINVDIVQPKIAHYRLPLYYGLINNSKINLNVQASSNNNGSTFRALDSHFDINHPTLSLFGGRLKWQRGLKLVLAKHPGDVLIVCGDLHFLSTLLIIFRAKLRGVGVLWWTHHRSAGSRNWRVKIRLLIARLLSDCVLLYTNAGVKYLIEYGFDKDRLFACGNTIDNRESLNAAQAWSSEALLAFKKEIGLENQPIFLFSSVLRKKVQLDLLLKALADGQLKAKSWHLVIIGDGEMAEDYRALAKSLRIDHRITWVGALYDEEKLAPWFLSASYFVYPGSIGLSLLHAFSYGLPVITHNCASKHMPEFEALKPNINGITFREGSVIDLSDTLINALELSESVYHQMATEAWQTAHEDYSMESMVHNFTMAILACSVFSESNL
jgi:glycosyltransferase involved in cell wall biosynthesis